MSTIVKTNIVKIGNSHGIRIPKLLLEQIGLMGQVEVEAQSHQLVVRPIVKTIREGWAEKFQEMAASGDDTLLDEETLAASQWDEEEWQW